MTNSARAYAPEVQANDMKVSGWVRVPGHTVNHYFDGTWTLCQHFGAYHGAKAVKARELPECVHCAKLVQLQERLYGRHNETKEVDGQ